MRRTYDGERSEVLGPLQGFSRTHVNQIHVSQVIHHDVFWFDVSVDDLLWVQVLQHQYECSDVELSVWDCEKTDLSDDVE